MPVPGVEVLGVGAVELDVPPEDTVYHFNVFPASGVAETAVAVAFWQYVTGLVTVGSPGIAFTFTAIAALGPSQEGVPADDWLT